MLSSPTGQKIGIVTGSANRIRFHFYETDKLLIVEVPHQQVHNLTIKVDFSMKVRTSLILTSELTTDQLLNSLNQKKNETSYLPLN